MFNGQNPFNFAKWHDIKKLTLCSEQHERKTKGHVKPPQPTQPRDYFAAYSLLKAVMWQFKKALCHSIWEMTAIGVWLNYKLEYGYEENNIVRFVI